MGCISRFIWTFQCLTLVLACRSFRWAAWQGTEERSELVPHCPCSGTVGTGFPSLSRPGWEVPSGTETQFTLL